MKKVNDLSQLGDLVYSTDKSLDISPASKKETLSLNEDIKDEIIEAHFLKKGRSGKVVTLLKGFKRNEEEVKTLAKEIKTILGVGGTSKNKEIIIQGNNREKILSILEIKKIKTKRVGG